MSLGLIREEEWEREREIGKKERKRKREGKIVKYSAHFRN